MEYSPLTRLIIALLLLSFSISSIAARNSSTAGKMTIIRNIINPLAITTAQCYQDLTQYYRDNDDTCPATGTICDYHFTGSRYSPIHFIRNETLNGYCRILVRFKTKAGTNGRSITVPTALSGKSIAIVPSKTAAGEYVFNPPTTYSNLDMTQIFPNATATHGATLSGTDLGAEIILVPSMSQAIPPNI
jgi:hypothetical protein